MKYIVPRSALLLAMVSPLVVFSAVKTDTPTQKETGFADDSLAPFVVCTTQRPAYVESFTLGGSKCVKFYWTHKGYDGTRKDRGAELCGSPPIYKEGWMGFHFYLPSPGFPSDKDQAIAQIFSNGGTCPSWAGMLLVRNNQLVFTRRHACIEPVEAVIAKDIPRNTWLPVIIHFTASRLNAGVVEIWYGNACAGYGASTPTYRAAKINFGWGLWLGKTDSLDPAQPDKAIGLKVGMYNYDVGGYTDGESRTLYMDNVSMQNFTNANAWSAVNPTK